MEYEVVIGLEVHAQLDTESKLFCGCSTAFDAAPNHHVCPVCLGFPGVLPVPNKKAIDLVIKTCLALGCEIPGVSRFARKNYYYPDLPKAYQISQYEAPVGVNGAIEVQLEGRTKKIRIHRVHIEEDAGKLIHEEGGAGSLVDYNRTGIPLMEIVTEADIRSSEEAVAYLTQLRSVLQYIGVCEGNMEKGEMRCEPNISVRPVGRAEFGTKTELKNINSFKAVQRGIEYETARQIDALGEGGRIVQETRRWDDATQTTVTMRIKERAHDYRYFPDPDLVPIEIDGMWIESIRSEIPELPVQRLNRFIREYGLPEYDAGVLTATRSLSDYYEKVVSGFSDAKQVSNWIMTELLGHLQKHEQGESIEDCLIKPDDFAELLALVKKGGISARMGKDIFKEMFATGKDAGAIVREQGLAQVSDEGELAAAVEKAIAENPGPAADFRGGKEKALGFLIGQVMKITGGKANPKIVAKMITERLL